MQKGKWLKKIILAAVLVMVFAGMCGFSSRAAEPDVEWSANSVTLSGNGDSTKITLMNNGTNSVNVTWTANTCVTVSAPTLPINGSSGTGEFVIKCNTSAYGIYQDAITFTVTGTGAVEGSKSQKIKVVIAPKSLTVSADKMVSSPGGKVQCYAKADGNAISGVSWSVSGNNGSTTINTSTGLLEIGAGETATTLVVTGTYSYDGGSISNSIAISLSSKVYTVTPKSENTDKGTVSGGGAVAQNGNITIYASPCSECSFIGWYLDGKQVSASPTYTVTNVTKDVTYEARFIGKEYKIKVKKNIDEAGTVSGYKTVRYGDDVTVRVKSVAAGYRFIGWKEGSKLLTEKEELKLKNVKEDRTVVAHFEKTNGNVTTTQPVLPCIVNLINEPANGGTYAGSGVYNPGTNVTITAIPAAGYTFTGWRYNGEIFSNAQSFVLQNISQSYDITAVYAKKASSSKKTTTPKKEEKEVKTDSSALPDKVSEEAKAEEEAVEAEELTGVLAEKDMTVTEAKEQLEGSQGMELLGEAQKKGDLQIFVKNDMDEDGTGAAPLKEMKVSGILNLDAVIGSMLTEEEKLKALQGEKVEVEVSLSNVSYGISEEEKEAFETFAGKDLNIATYFDLSLYKTVADEKKAVTWLQNGMVVVLDIPDEFRDSAQERQYFIIRKHVNPDGSVLMSVLEDEDENPATITFQTDKFSTYAISYSGKAITQGAGNTAISTDKQYYALFLVIGVMGIVTLITIVLALVGNREKYSDEETEMNTNGES